MAGGTRPVAPSLDCGGYSGHDGQARRRSEVMSDKTKPRLPECDTADGSEYPIAMRPRDLWDKPPPKGKHGCGPSGGGTPSDGYGAAIDVCYEDKEGRFWADNGEYSSQVNYCPWCGAKAPMQIEEGER